ncbi:MAG TPA: glycosyltransferase family 2 protein [bacterium]|nr:glycosyltransferase family 2 protein [bacterium]
MQHTEPKLFALIPAYNEEKNIERAIQRTIAALEPLARPFVIIVINDGSRDATRAIVERQGAADPRVQLLNHATNRGVGQVFRTGFQHVLAAAAPDDWVLTTEADNTSDVGILPEMLRRLAAGDDLVLASCYAPGGGVTGTGVHRHFLSAVANAFIRQLFGLRRLHTFSSFYRLYRVAVLRRVCEKYGEQLIDSPGFSCMVELLVRIHRLGGVRISEVPMVLRGEERIGASNMKVMKTIIGYFELFWRELKHR